MTSDETPTPTITLAPLVIQQQVVEHSLYLNRVLSFLLENEPGSVSLTDLTALLESVTTFRAVLKKFLAYQPNNKILSHTVEAFTLQAEVLESIISRQQLTTLYNFTQEDGDKPN
jgi:hypothetical protein